MICLRCGYCCREIWPGNNNESETKKPCPHLIQVPGGVAICEIYSTRSQACKDECMGCGEKEPCGIGLLALARNEVHAPIGKCQNCGSLFWSTEHSPFCSPECEEEAIDYLNGT